MEKNYSKPEKYINIFLHIDISCFISYRYHTFKCPEKDYYQTISVFKLSILIGVFQAIFDLSSGRSQNLKPFFFFTIDGLIINK